MIAFVQANHMAFLRCATGMLVIADESSRAIDRVRASQREIGMVQGGGGVIRQACSEFDSGFVLKTEIPCCVGQFFQLAPSSLNDAFTAISGIDAPQARKTVQKAVSLAIGQPDAFPGFENCCAIGFMALP